MYAQLRELGWVDAHTVVVIVGDGAEWIWQPGHYEPDPSYFDSGDGYYDNY